MSGCCIQVSHGLGALRRAAHEGHELEYRMSALDVDIESRNDYPG